MGNYATYDKLLKCNNLFDKVHFKTYYVNAYVKYDDKNHPQYLVDTNYTNEYTMCKK
jgi:hypothetical protein